MANLGILDNQYNILEKKLSDGYNDLYSAQHNQTHVNYLITIKKPDNNANNNFPANELNVLQILHNINNPYILHYIGNGNGILALNNKPPRNVNYLIFEYSSKFCLFDYIFVEKLTERQAKLLFKKILNGVQTIHNNNICHRNIKLENIILDENYNPKIFNFYFSTINANNLNDYVGSRSYSAPEIFQNHPYDGYKADIFSLGQLLFNIVNKINGFKSSSNNDHYYSLIRNNHLNEYWNTGPLHNLNPSNEFKNLFVRMVAYDPFQRPTIDEILNSPWMQELNNLNNDELNALENELRNELHNREAHINNDIINDDD